MALEFKKMPVSFLTDGH